MFREQDVAASLDGGTVILVHRPTGTSVTLKAGDAVAALRQMVLASPTQTASGRF